MIDDFASLFGYTYSSCVKEVENDEVKFTEIPSQDGYSRKYKAYMAEDDVMMYVYFYKDKLWKIECVYNEGETASIASMVGIYGDKFLEETVEELGLVFVGETDELGYRAIKFSSRAKYKGIIEYLYINLENNDLLFQFYSTQYSPF